MSKSIFVNINPELLIWARKSSHYDIADAAKRAVISIDTLRKCEAGESQLTIRQLEKLAKVYKRPLAVFLLPKPPDQYDRPFNALDLRDFRRLPESEISVFSPSLILELRKAEDRREVIIDLLTQLEIPIPKFDLKAQSEESPEELAQRIRDVFGVTIDQQMNWANTSSALKSWISLVEQTGVLVFQTGIYQKREIPVAEMRGIAVSMSLLPIIIVNGKDSLSARIFTLMHEYCHLLLGVSGVSEVTIGYLSPQSPDEQIEIFCNRFAAELLVPMENFLATDEVGAHQNIGVWGDEEIDVLKKLFNVSREVILRRLLTGQFISVKYYQRKRDEYLYKYEESQKAKDKRQSGGPPRDRLLEKFHGSRYISTVLEAYHNNIIGLRDSLAYLDAKTTSFEKLERRLSI